MVIGIGIVRAIGVVVRRSYAGIVQWRVAQTYTNEVVGRFVRQPLSWHARRPDGDLVQRAGVDTEGSVAVLGPIPFATSTVIMIFVSTIWLFSIDIALGVVAIVLFPTLIVTNVIYERAVSVHYTRAQDQLGEFSAGVHESFEGVQLVKSYGAEERETDRLAGLAERVRAERLKAIRIRSWFEGLLDVIPSLANILLVVIGAARIQTNDLSVGEFSSAIFLFTLLVLPLRLIGYALSELPRSIAAWTRVRTVAEEPLEADPADSIEPASPGLGVELHGVSFVHVGEEFPALDRVDLRRARRLGHGAGRPDRVGQVDAGDARGRPARADHRVRAARPRQAFGRVPGGVPARRQRRRQRPDGRRVLRRRAVGRPRDGGGVRLRRASCRTASTRSSANAASA